MKTAEIKNEVSPDVQQSRLIGTLLLEQGAITDLDLKKALDVQASVGGLLGSILIRAGALSEELLLQKLARQLGRRLVGVDVHLPDFHDLFMGMDETKIVFDWYLDQNLVHWWDGDKVICCCKHLTPYTKDTMRYFFPESSVEYCLISTQEIDAVLDFIKKEKSVDELILQSSSTSALRELAEEAPVVELLNNILSQAIDTNSSDVHIEPDDEGFAVRFRTDGILYTRFRQPAERFPAVASRIKLISGLDIAERRLPQDGRITTRVSGADMDVRVSTLPGVHGESIVMRLLPKNRDVVKIDNLGLEQDHLEILQRSIRESNGMFLVTGPTGSGKSTTLSGALGAANDGKKKIVSVEDPVEFVVPGVTQIQAHADIGYTFAKALRAILRQDPDVIMVGEIRDKETADIAVQAAMTGHMVFSTVHTNDALSVFSRLIDMGVEPFLAAAPMKLVQAQRLVRRLCEHCAESVVVDNKLEEDFTRLGMNFSANWKKSVGCKRCAEVGYKGRTGIYEIYEILPEIRELVVKQESISKIRKHYQDLGYRNLYQDGLIKAARGLTTIEEVVRVTSGVED
jgi:general secretion pathway protein E